MEKPTVFQRYCEKAVAAINEQDVENFKKTTNEEDRIKIIYQFAKNIPIESIKNGKNYDEAQGEKAKGNGFFARKDYENALKAYNRGIICCPQTSDDERELLTILISNRSATYFDLKEYKKVFDDIDYLLAIGNYPQRLHHKIWLRKAKCYDALQNQKYADEAYNLALKSLKHANLAPDLLEKKINEINESLNDHKEVNGIVKISDSLMPVSNSDQFIGGNKMYISAHRNVTFDYSQGFGRFARAVENIDTGVVIIEENPHCAVLSYDNILTNCQNCCLSTNQPVACPNCGHVVFCSLNCERKANTGYHRIECTIQPIIFESGASINCSMAIRMISQKPFKFFHQNRKVLKDYLRDNCKKAPIKQPYYRSDDYNTVFFLCRNENLRKKEELVHYACMAIYLVRLLKVANYFDNQTIINTDLSGDEIFIASLILRHLQILQFNSHEISEIRNSDNKPELITDSFYNNACIGAGLYPTLALFNHSCDPSIIRYNVGNKIIARTIKPVKAGDIIFENYGPLYTSVNIDERRSYLQDRYWFECFCIPCQEEWPLFTKMNNNQMKLACQTKNCPYQFTIHKDDVMPFLQCEWCNKTTQIFSYLKGLLVLEKLLPHAENLYCSGEIRDAIKSFVACLDILFKYSEPPCPDMVKAQQRLRTLFIHLGNKSFNYVQNL